jgi:hypothetical protein
MPRGAVLLLLVSSLLYFCAVNSLSVFTAAINFAPSMTTLELRLDPKTFGTQQGKLDFIPFFAANVKAVP